MQIHKFRDTAKICTKPTWHKSEPDTATIRIEEIPEVVEKLTAIYREQTTQTIIKHASERLTGRALELFTSALDGASITHIQNLLGALEVTGGDDERIVGSWGKIGVVTDIIRPHTLCPDEVGITEEEIRSDFWGEKLIKSDSKKLVLTGIRDMGNLPWQLIYMLASPDGATTNVEFQSHQNVAGGYNIKIHTLEGFGSASRIVQSMPHVYRITELWSQWK